MADLKASSFKELHSRLSALGQADKLSVAAGTDLEQYLKGTFGLGRAIAADYGCIFIGDDLLFRKDQRRS